MFENKKIIVLGFKKSGYAVANYLADNNEIIINDFSKDQDEEHIKNLEKKNVKIILGEHPDNLIDETIDYLIKNPGVPIDHKYVKEANRLNIPVINEVEVGYLLLPKGVEIVAITGTNGKTTTTSLIYEMLHKNFGDKVHLSGNIGIPLMNKLKDIKNGDILVIEISVQQLENLYEFHPHIAVLTNLSEAHLEFFPSYEHYLNNKIKIFQKFDENDFAILNKKDAKVLEYTKNIKGQKEYFNDEKRDYLKDDIIYFNDKPLIELDKLQIVGNHNVENILAALGVMHHFEVEREKLIESLKNFKGVAHRLEYVGGKNIKFYDDSQATNIKCATIALDSFKEPTVLFLGGYERGQDFKKLIPHAKNIRMIVGLGETNKKAKELAEILNVKYLDSLTIKQAFKDLEGKIKKDDVILLSPASASWDQYKSADDRGDEFKELSRKFLEKYDEKL